MSNWRNDFKQQQPEAAAVELHCLRYYGFLLQPARAIVSRFPSDGNSMCIVVARHNCHRV